MPLLRRILREPLVHFLFIGWLLFVLYNLISAQQGGSERQVVLSSAMINEIAQGFQSTWQRPPSAEELQGLLEARVREELLFREGLALGLEADDPVIRRRIAQKVDVLAEESALVDAASDSQLEDFLQRNAARYALPAEVAFEQVLFDPNRHGFDERRHALRREAVVRLQQAFKLEKRLVVKRNGLEVGQVGAALFQHKPDGLRRKPRVVFLPGKPFFLRRSDDLPAVGDGCGCVVVVC